MKLHPFLVSILLTAVSLWSVSAKKVKVAMGNYVQSHLTKEEHVVFEARYNGCIWILPVIAFIFFSIPLFFVLGYAPPGEAADNMGFPCAMFLIGLWILIYTYIRIHTDEFAITN